MDRVVRGYGVEIVPQPDSAFAGKDDDAVLVLMPLERCKTAWRDAKTSHFKGGLRFGHEVETRDGLPSAREVFVFLRLDAFPVFSFPPLNHENITIAFRISPFFIA